MNDINREQLLQAVEYADRWVAYQQQLKRTPGIAVAIRFDGELLLSKGYGFADLEHDVPVTGQHIFRIASHSKTFTATAIMQLVEQGKLRLDDPIARYIPWLPAGLSGVTIRQVLNHAAGIVRDSNDSNFWQLDRPFPDSAELQQMVEDGGEVLPANERFKYSNIGYSLLGSVIEAASGLPYNEYVQRNIVDRLGLQNTGPETNAEAQRGMVTGYTADLPGFPRRPLPDVSTNAMSAATGFYSNAEDLSRYAAAHAPGTGELLSDASKREMQQPYWEVEGDETHYGLGFAISEIGERRMVGHGGGFPGHSTRTMFDPQDRLVVVVLTNETGGPSQTLAAGIVKIINYALSKPASAGDAARLDRFVGRFVNPWGYTDIVRFGNALVELAPGNDDPPKFASELEVVDDATLRIAKTNGYGSPGETIRYVRDADGKVTRIIHAGSNMYTEAALQERLAERSAAASR